MKNLPTKILYVEDDKTLSFITRESLQKLGYKVTCYHDGQKALEEYCPEKYDICLFDIMLPHLDGINLVRQIRTVDKETPIIFLTAKSMLSDKIQGLKMGADDFITKPYSMEELLLKIKVFLKRQNGNYKRHKEIIKMGNYTYCDSTLLLKGPGFEKRLTKRESELLKYFYHNQDILLTRDEILNAIWKDNDYFLGRSMDVFISRLRKFLRNDPNIHLKTVHGYGFIVRIGENAKSA